MENLGNRVNAGLATNHKEYQRLVSRLSVVFHNLVAILKIKR